jgi:hypothetical protein
LAFLVFSSQQDAYERPIVIDKAPGPAREEKTARFVEEKQHVKDFPRGDDDSISDHQQQGRYRQSSAPSDGGVRTSDPTNNRGGLLQQDRPGMTALMSLMPAASGE